VVNTSSQNADIRIVRLDAPRSVSVPVSEGQEIASVNDRRVPNNQVSQRGAASGLPPLEIGQELQGLVVEELDGGRLLLALGATLIETDGPGGLSAGQHLHLRVEQLQPNIVLHITSLEPALETEVARLVRVHLPAHADSGELLDSLQFELDAYVDSRSNTTPNVESLAKLRESIGSLLARDAPPAPENLESLARDGGLHYEAKLFHVAANDTDQLQELVDHDLKGLLLAALQESKARPFSTGLQEALSAQLNNIEAQQAVNLLAQLDGGAFQIQIPFFTGSGFSTAALALEQDGHGSTSKRAKEKSGFTLLFLLDLENFGRTRIDAHIDAVELRAVFYVANEGSLRLFRQELPEFRQTLLAFGYRDVLLAAKPLREMPQEKQEKFAALAVGAPSSIHLLDVKA
jgi:hypothetical protein